MDVSNPAHTAIAERVGVDGYPTLLVYQHGVRVAEYHGGRTHRYLPSPSTTVSTAPSYT
jgi:hypothetical protein